MFRLVRAEKSGSGACWVPGECVKGVLRVTFLCNITWTVLERHGDDHDASTHDCIDSKKLTFSH